MEPGLEYRACHLLFLFTFTSATITLAVHCFYGAFFFVSEWPIAFQQADLLDRMANTRAALGFSLF